MMTVWEAGYDLPPDPVRPVKAPDIPTKGCCKHCGKRIGRGLRFHERACAK